MMKRVNSILERIGRRFPDRRAGTALLALGVLVLGGIGLRSVLRPRSRPPAGPPVTRVFLSSFHMISETEGWGVTSDPDTGQESVLKTRDGGTTWTYASPALPSGDEVFISTAFLDSDSAWVAASVEAEEAAQPSVSVLGTSDGGVTWKEKGELPIADVPQLDFIDRDTGWAFAIVGVSGGAEAYELFRTTDGGSHWGLVSAATSPQIKGRASTPNSVPPCGLAGVSFVDASTGWLPTSCAGHPALYESRDGGSSWSRQRLGPSDSPYREGTLGLPVFTSPRDGFLLDKGVSGGTDLLYVTHDAGAHWRPVNLPVRDFDVGPAFSDSLNGWLVSNGTVYRTTDGGGRWTAVSRVPIGSAESTSLRLDFATTEVGWISSTDPSAPLLIKTTDGGRTWKASNLD
jgi:photosystem II stability/assembly factor-like uncharacterized protein